MEAIRPHLGVCPQYNVLFDMWVSEGLGCGLGGGWVLLGLCLPQGPLCSL